MIEQVNIYEFTPDDPFKAPQLMKVLKLNFCGLVGVHVLDNAIFIHHKVKNIFKFNKIFLTLFS